MNSFTLNVIFLFLGIVLGFGFTFILERIKEWILRGKVASVLQNEISICSESARADLENLENIIDTPKIYHMDRSTLTKFLLSRKIYTTIFFDIYKNSIHLFRKDSQEAISIFYSLIFSLKEDIQRIHPLAIDPTGPPRPPVREIGEFFEIQKEVRKNIINKAKDCEKLLKTEPKFRLKDKSLKQITND